MSLAKALRLSEDAVRKRMRAMHEKGCLVIEERSKSGHLVRVRLPDEVPGVLPTEIDGATVDISTIDFFHDRKHLRALVVRENARCFYCLRQIEPDTCALDHVVPQVAGADHSYRNVVASCHECNALKQDQPAADFLRSLYRSGVLSQGDLHERLSALDRLQEGRLVPELVAAPC